jgi:hypothetical protein
MVKVNPKLQPKKVLELEELFRKYKDVFAWMCKDLKGIPPKLAQHIIELDITIPLTHQATYRLNLNYIIIVKQDIDKLLAIGFIQHVEEATWCHQLW